jgi:hypothetical protein
VLPKLWHHLYCLSIRSFLLLPAATWPVKQKHLLFSWIFSVRCLSLKFKVTWQFEMLLTSRPQTQLCAPQGTNLQQRSCESVKRLHLYPVYPATLSGLLHDGCASPKDENDWLIDWLANWKTDGPTDWLTDGFSYKYITLPFSQNVWIQKFIFFFQLSYLTTL